MLASVGLGIGGRRGREVGCGGPGDPASRGGGGGPGRHGWRDIRVFSALHHRNFRLFWFGQIISVTGTWMQSIGQAWLVLQLTHNAFLLGVVSALQFLPVLVLSLVGGVVADKLPKRRLLMFTQTVAMIQAFAMFALAATGTVRVWHVMVLAACLGTVNALDMPTRQAFITEMVGRDDLMNAISLNSAQFNASRVVGPGIAGVLIAVLGIPPLFLVNAVSYVAVLVGLAMMDPTRLHAPVGARVSDRPLRQIRDGVAFAWRTPPIRLALLMIFAVSTFGMNFNIILPLLAERTFRTGATGYGVMSSLLGFGSLVAALVLAGTVKRPRVGLLVASAGAFSVLEIVLARIQAPIPAYGALALIGFATIAFAATANTLLQTNSPDAMRGRVMALYSMLFAGSTPIGALAIGALAGRVGASGALFIGALPCLAAVAYGASVWRATAAFRAPGGTVAPDVEADSGPAASQRAAPGTLAPDGAPAVSPAAIALPSAAEPTSRSA